MIHIRSQNKFFTDPFPAPNVNVAFNQFLIELVQSELALITDIDPLFEQGYIPALKLAQDDSVQFMFSKEVSKPMIFSLFDEGGWRFFGRL